MSTTYILLVFIDSFIQSPTSTIQPRVGRRYEPTKAQATIYPFHDDFGSTVVVVRSGLLFQ